MCIILKLFIHVVNKLITNLIFKRTYPAQKLFSVNLNTLNVKNKASASIIDLRKTPGNNVNCELHLMLLIDYKSRISISSWFEKKIF